MTAAKIVDAMARAHMVEDIVCNIAGRGLDDDLKDLCQMIYTIVLTYDGAKVVDLWESGAMRFFVARVACTQYRSRHSEFYAAVRRFRERTAEIGLRDWADRTAEGDERR